MHQQTTHRLAAAVGFTVCVLIGGSVRAAEPITIGFGMAVTGGLAAGGKSALLAMQIWPDNVNARGGLMGRPVKLINYDDQSNPATVPGIYTKLLDVDKVDFIVSGYGTNLIAPGMPVPLTGYEPSKRTCSALPRSASIASATIASPVEPSRSMKNT